MTLDDTIKFISVREAGKRCHDQLNQSIVTSAKVSPSQQIKRDNTVSLNKNFNNPKNHKSSLSDDRPCAWCGKVGHGGKPNLDTRKKSCPAYGKFCSNCHKLGHFQSSCRARKHINTTSLDNQESISDNSYYPPWWYS